MDEIVIGSRYRHYKGNEYEVLALGKHTETEEDMVIYQRIEGGEVWIRPRQLFLAEVEWEGKTVPRFTRVV